MRLRAEGLASKHVDGRVMLLDLASNTYFAVGGSGVLLLDRLREGSADVDDLVGLLVATYDVDPDRAAQDVQAFLGRLEAAGLLEA